MSLPATLVAVTLLVGTTAAPASAPVRNQLQNHPSPYLALYVGMTDLSGQPCHHASHLTVLRNYPPDSAAAR